MLIVVVRILILNFKIIWLLKHFRLSILSTLSTLSYFSALNTEDNERWWADEPLNKYNILVWDIL